MKKLVYAAWMMMVVLTIGCDKIPDPILDINVYREDIYGPPPTFTSMQDATQNVLLEDFTGHQCGNCPDGHEIAAGVMEEHPDRVSVVSIHAGSLAQPDAIFGYPADHRTEEGQFYLLTQVGVDLMPKGRINRLPGASTIFGINEWVAQVNDALAGRPQVGLQMEVDYSALNQQLNVHVYHQWFEGADNDYRLVVQVVESHIIGSQLWYEHDPEFNPSYEHNHVLRGTVTGATGLSVISSPSAGSSNVDSYTMDWNAAWLPENCDIVAFITDGDNGEVLNVVRKKLIE